jgi:hypothetical protein
MPRAAHPTWRSHRPQHADPPASQLGRQVPFEGPVEPPGRGQFGQVWGWPPADLTLEPDLPLDRYEALPDR